MMIARATGSDGGDILLLGLTAENIRRLQAGEPMLVSRETHGEGVPTGWTISIMFGETEQAIYDVLKKAGAIGPDTKIRRDPRI